MTVQAVLEVDSWTACVAAGLPVGSCSMFECGGSLRGDLPERIGGKVWYSATCDRCGHEIVSPDGRTTAPTEPMRVAAARPSWAHVGTGERERDARERAAGD